MIVRYLVDMMTEFGLEFFKQFSNTTSCVVLFGGCNLLVCCQGHI